jgi:hypothetical protein
MFWVRGSGLEMRVMVALRSVGYNRERLVERLVNWQVC